MSVPAAVDLLVVGGGINGCGIARDAAGRGLSVLLVERDDLAAHTSSASTKLIHGGLRYLEYYDFRLVREALAEREVLLGLAPHLIRPLRFVMPLAAGSRPAWMIRAGLLLYDRLGGRTRLPRSESVDLRGAPFGAGLKGVTRGFAYSDAWVDDARLVVLNALGAAERGATIRPRLGFRSARREGDRWLATLDDGSTVTARAIVNAAGAWVGELLGAIPDTKAEAPPRLVKGSHIIVPRLYEGEHAYILQNEDRRVVFAIPYEGAFTLIGTTDVPYEGDRARPHITDDETDYLVRAVNRYLARPIGAGDVLSSYSGVRALFDDGAADASAVTRDYVLSLGSDEGPPLLSVFGGKITTYRRLAENALERLARHFPGLGARWTRDAPLPGGDLPPDGIDAFIADVRARWPFLSAANATRLARAYGTRIERVLGDATGIEDWGGGLSEREVDHLVAHEWAQTADDILWRRTKIGLHSGAETRARIMRRLA